MTCKLAEVAAASFCSRSISAAKAGSTAAARVYATTNLVDVGLGGPLRPEAPEDVHVLPLGKACEAHQQRRPLEAKVPRWHCHMHGPPVVLEGLALCKVV